ITESVPTLLEPGLPGWLVYLDENQNGQRDSGEPFTTTDADGHYAFTNLAPGTYRVAEELQSGWVQTAPPAQVFTPTVPARQVQTGLDFGNRPAAAVGGNAPPVFGTTPPSSVAVGQLFAYAAKANDPDGDAVTYDLLSGPAGLVVQGSTGQVFWVPTADEVG